MSVYMKASELYETYRALSKELEACQYYLAHIEKASQQWFEDAYTHQRQIHDVQSSDVWSLLQKQYDCVVPKQRLDHVYDVYVDHIDNVKRRMEVLTQEIGICQEKLCQIDTE